MGGICTLGEEICELEEDILWVWEEICEQGEDILSAWEEICEQVEESLRAWVETCAWVEIYALLHDDDGDVCESDDEIRGSKSIKIQSCRPHQHPLLMALVSPTFPTRGTKSSPNMVHTSP